MKRFTVILLFVFLATNSCLAQQWQFEAMAGISAYSGDLSRPAYSFKTAGPNFGMNMKYFFPNRYLGIRAGMSYGTVHAADSKNNKDADLRNRNLSFKSAIFEMNVCAEVNVLNPNTHRSMPYVFAGLGIANFNPFADDNNGNKTFLRPLGTEGEGLSEYPSKKIYSKSTLSIPFGLGYKYYINEKISLAYEFAFHALRTDYLDDVSGTYADPQILLAKRGQKAVDMAYRQKSPAVVAAGRKRGNSEANDWYYTTGIKVIVNLGASNGEFSTPGQIVKL